MAKSNGGWGSGSKRERSHNNHNADEWKWKSRGTQHQPQPQQKSCRRGDRRWILGVFVIVTVVASVTQIRYFFSVRVFFIDSDAEDGVLDAPRLTEFSNGPAKKTTKEKRTLEPILYPTTQPQIWDNSTVIPDWMKRYLQWHQEQRLLLNETTWKNYRYMVMVAPKNTMTGGATDRLRPLPTMIRIANFTNRLLMIYWERPAHLEEFLLPPQGGLDWRAPDFLVPRIQSTKANGILQEIISHAKGTRRHQIMTTFYQSSHYGEEYYDKHGEKQGEASAKSVLHDFWHVAFTPSPPVASLIEAEYQQMGIVPGEYATAHIRALYNAKKDKQPHHWQQLTINAMNCASELRPGGPFFVASDSANARELAMSYGKEKNVTVVSSTQATQQKQPLHISQHQAGEDGDGTNLTVSDFYDTFVDIYLIGMTRCVAFGKGGYGQWGVVLGYNSSCVIRHHGSKLAKQCNWTDHRHDAPSLEQQDGREKQHLQLPLFRTPMQDRHHDRKRDK